MNNFRVRVLLGIWLVLICGQTYAETPASFGVALKRLSFIDDSRPLAAAFDFPGADVRRIDLMVWYPAATDAPGVHEEVAPAAGSRPLVIYAHGTYGHPDNATHFVYHLVSHGYVVAAPVFPLTSRASFAGLPMADVTDTPNQPGDVSFVIDQLLAHPFFAPVIDPQRIGTSGHSLGAVTSYFLNYGAGLRDTRVRASALIGAGDPVQAALASDFGFDGVAHLPVSVPVLFLSADKDVYANLGGRPGAAYARVEPPKFAVMVHNGTHVWFRDGSDTLADGRNPDCAFFDRYLPQTRIPGCLQATQLIAPVRQQEITRMALLAFFDGYLKDDQRALQRLRDLEQIFAETSVRYEE